MTEFAFLYELGITLDHGQIVCKNCRKPLAGCNASGCGQRQRPGWRLGTDNVSPDYPPTGDAHRPNPVQRISDHLKRLDARLARIENQLDTIEQHHAEAVASGDIECEVCRQRDEVTYNRSVGRPGYGS